MTLHKTLFFILVAAGCPGPVLSQTDGFLEKTRSRQETIAAEIRNASYVATAFGREYTEQGEVKRETETIRKIRVQGDEILRTEYLSYKIDGRELEGNERKTEIEKAESRSGGRQVRLPFSASSWTEFLYMVEGASVVEGRPVRLVSFEPRHARAGAIRGKAAILEETGDIIRLDFEPARTAFLVRKAEFQLGYSRIGRYWLPVRFHMELIVKLKAVVDLAYVRVVVDETYSDYRLNTDGSVIPAAK